MVMIEFTAEHNSVSVTKADDDETRVQSNVIVTPRSVCELHKYVLLANHV